jgi:hypothetical protein
MALRAASANRLHDPRRKDRAVRSDDVGDLPSNEARRRGFEGRGLDPGRLPRHESGDEQDDAVDKRGDRPDAEEDGRDDDR